MAVLPIVMHPDPILVKRCEPVKEFDKKLKKLLDNMYETMIEADGVGLAAPQVGVDLQVAVVDIGDESGTIELINPEIFEHSGEQTDLEGCLSFPGLFGEVSRPYSISFRTQDRKGRWLEGRAEGFLARAIQHEIDHLHGVLFNTKTEKLLTEDELERFEEE
ncbi:peptide deformylase [Rossellomorea marisflavi]|uniref:Peptide deformylase n=1 Tax=Rossellomorea marisflavi TaxID=189381 RepID=A0A0J5SN69_9BACI|nr:peptide deformylase [Rossellomorea marisflavi]KMK96562.1 peptide deformylase [Rossellomorea marisflavi]KML06398.1 peptide deformylase [Rossellomorea marisflavi]KML32784.1 peptide deformylase [Rossellomorea marisflavi]KZE49767.1 peptide deformylase [Rossellomorea marisflavi]MCM2603535.1 peptide deformylase [Rossellomorea marisflavi]